ncbi:hypothetical protein WPS_26490 [Vulcanimicrobium alpinum]|uniref:Uncharacterized protein n=1 Tax=Vulcanimicrobium alpinum TaxID=3016050 RepID=A0AAN1XZQ4_UNVUL|nr:hypothetical protein WPS_26490 [Vulcanimicrobium alpinum]
MRSRSITPACGAIPFANAAYDCGFPSVSPSGSALADGDAPPFTRTPPGPGDPCGSGEGVPSGETGTGTGVPLAAAFGTAEGAAEAAAAAGTAFPAPCAAANDAVTLNAATKQTATSRTIEPERFHTPPAKPAARPPGPTMSAPAVRGCGGHSERAQARRAESDVKT